MEVCKNLESKKMWSSKKFGIKQNFYTLFRVLEESGELQSVRCEHHVTVAASIFALSDNRGERVSRWEEIFAVADAYLLTNRSRA